MSAANHIGLSFGLTVYEVEYIEVPQYGDAGRYITIPTPLPDDGYFSFKASIISGKNGNNRFTYGLMITTDSVTSNYTKNRTMLYGDPASGLTLNRVYFEAGHSDGSYIDGIGGKAAPFDIDFENYTYHVKPYDVAGTHRLCICRSLPMKFYSCTIYDTNMNKLVDIIPAKRGAYAGVWDKVSEKFYDNGMTNLLYGPTVGVISNVGGGLIRWCQYVQTIAETETRAAA